jgi:hypothetical protein
VLLGQLFYHALPIVPIPVSCHGPNLKAKLLEKDRSEFASPPRAVGYMLNNASDNLIRVFLTLKNIPDYLSRKGIAMCRINLLCFAPLSYYPIP